MKRVLVPESGPYKQRGFRQILQTLTRAPVSWAALLDDW